MIYAVLNGSLPALQSTCEVSFRQKTISFETDEKHKRSDLGRNHVFRKRPRLSIFKVSKVQN